MKGVYLDYAATTPLDPKVLKVMQPYFGESFGNPSSLHSYGQQASAVVFKARRKIADILGVQYPEIVFTGSATEANNLALRGIAKKGDKIIVSAIEHESILATARDLEKQGVKVTYLSVSKSGIVDLKKLEKEIDKDTVLISIMQANNEVGTIQAIRKIATLIRNLKLKIKNSAEAKYPLLHTDAVQAFQYFDCRPEDLGVDLMTLSAHKIYGPKGIGLLYVKKGIELRPIITGGGQEEELRSGTENVANIVGFAEAIELAEKSRIKESERIKRLRDWFLKELKKIFSNLKLNGSSSQRLPNNLNLRLGELCSEKVLVYLDLNGVALSSGAACSARALEASPVLLAMGFSEKKALKSIRITLGRFTNKAELQKVLIEFKKLKKAFN